MTSCARPSCARSSSGDNQTAQPAHPTARTSAHHTLAADRPGFSPKTTGCPLANRFQVDHRGILVAQLLAHIDTLDGAIVTLDEKIEAMLAPHKRTVELLCTISGVALRTAQVLIRRVRP
jgi:transposase